MTTPMTGIKARLARWRAFMDGTGAGRFMFHVNFPHQEREAALPPAVPYWPENAGQRIERSWAVYERMRQRARLVNDDRVPFLNNETGTEIFAEAFGCKVHRPDNTNPFALPLVSSAVEADRLKAPAPCTGPLAYLFDIADELYRRGGPDALMKPVDIQSPMDIVALIWNKADLFIAMAEAPEAVTRLAAEVRKLLTSFFDEWFRRYGTVYVAHHPDYVMHGGITMSVDEVGAVSAGMFREFFRDELAALSEHFGAIGIHCCADARHQWANFRDIPGLKMINHYPPPSRDAGEYIRDSLRFYGAKVAQMPKGWTPDGAPETWPAQFPAGSRIVFEVQAENAVQAAAIADRLQAMRCI